MFFILKLILTSTILSLFLACSQENQQEHPHLGSTKNPPDLYEINRQNLQQDLVGTAYGNLFKIEQTLQKKEIAKAEQLAEETRYLLLRYVDNIEASNLPELVKRANSAIIDLDRMLYYLNTQALNKVAYHIRLCKIHLDSLRELTGLKRID